MTYVTSHPNDESKYRVVKLKDWWKDRETVQPISEHNTFEEAVKACEKLNKLEEMKG